MNSSPLNPDAPVFVPGTVAGSDVLLAESPRKPMPMDDIELPDVAQFETGAVVRPAELLDLDNCDQLNGHHKMSLDEVKEQCNGNNKYNMDSLGFGFSVGVEPEKGADSGLIQDFERIQKDTTDFCNIQVFQTHSETNPFASGDNDELLERLKNKERDPMSMSFYQEKDDDTCERLAKSEPQVDLNAVQTLPDSDDEEELQTNGVCGSHNDNEKENISPEQHSDLLGAANDGSEPNNDIIRFEERKDILTNTLNFGQGDFFMDYNVNSSNMQGYSNIEFDPSNNTQDAVAHTDTPESHKLLFEQIPEIPDGKSSELGFTTEDLLEQTESEKDTRILTPQDEISQDIDMENKNDYSPCIEEQSDFLSKAEEDQDPQTLGDSGDDDIVPEADIIEDHIPEPSGDRLSPSPVPVEDRLSEVISPEVSHNVENSVEVDVHQSSEKLEADDDEHIPQRDVPLETPDIKTDAEDLADAEVTQVCGPPSESLPAESPLPAQSPLPSHSPLPSQEHLPAESPAPSDSALVAESLVLAKSPLLSEFTAQSPAPAESPAPSQSPAVESPAPANSPFPAESPAPPADAHQQALGPPSHAAPPLSPAPAPAPAPSPLPLATPQPADVPLPRESPAPEYSSPVDTSMQREASPMIEEPVQSETILRPETASPRLSERAPDSPCPAPAPVESFSDSAALHERLSPEVAQEAFANETETAQEAFANEAEAAPAPDLVPDAPRSDLVTDIDIGIPESHAQEICVPVTSEIGHDAPALDTPPLSDTPIASVAPAAAVAAAAAAVAAGVGAVAAKKAIAKKSPTTPTAKPAAKTPAKAAASPRTPASAAKKPAASTTATASRLSSARAPAAATKPSVASPAAKAAAPKPPAPRTAPAKSAAPSTRAIAKPSAAPVKENLPAPITRPAPGAAAKAAPRPALKAPAPRAAPAPKPTARPPPITRPAARPASAPKPKPDLKPTEVKKPAEKKPLANGDVKDAKPAAARPIARAPAARPAPRPAPRAPAPTSAPVTAKSAVPKAAGRAAPGLDKLSKDLANKRITSKAAPPRTAATKTSAANKGVPMKVTRRPAASNGLGEAGALKPPPSPPAADNALLPDVIA